MTPAQQWKCLVTTARAVRQKAYAPYSKYRVGAALLTKDGKIFQGCNVENASYGLTICAERVALGAAVAAGHCDFRGIAIVAGDQPPMPCGACLQVLAEFCGPNFVVLSAAAKTGARPRQMRLQDLLPRRFRL